MALQALIWTPGSAPWSPATITTPPCLRQETPRRSCLPSEMLLRRYDTATRITYSGDFDTQTHDPCFSLQFRDIPAGPMPPATPKFAYGLVQMKKVLLFAVLKTHAKLHFIGTIDIFIGWSHQQPDEHPLPCGASEIPVSSHVWKDETGLWMVLQTLKLLKRGKLLDGYVCISLCLLCSVLWVHALSDHAAQGPLAAHATPVSTEWGSWPRIRVHQWGKPLQWTFVAY